MKTSQSTNLLGVTIKYGELEANMEGTFDEVWRLVNSFFKQIKANFISDTKGAVITTKGKSVPEILIELRNNGFFDNPKSSGQCLAKLKELGKTEIKLSAVQMALKRLVETGELKRASQSKGFAYIAPYVDFEGD